MAVALELFESNLVTELRFQEVGALLRVRLIGKENWPIRPGKAVGEIFCGNHVVDKGYRGIGRHLDGSIDDSPEVLVCLRLFEHALDETVGLFLAVLLQLVHPFGGAGDQFGASLRGDKAVEHNKAADVIGAQLFSIFRQFTARHGPADEDQLLQAQVVHQFFVVAGAGFRQMAIRRLVALALGTRVDRNDVVLFRELVDLLLPYPGRHRPTRNEYDRPTAAHFQVVNPNAIGSPEELTLGRLRQDARHRHATQKDYSESGSHVASAKSRSTILRAS